MIITASNIGAYKAQTGKDQYRMLTHFSLDTDTGVTTIEGVVVKNFFGSNPEEVHYGTVEECMRLIEEFGGVVVD